MRQPTSPHSWASDRADGRSLAPCGGVWVEARGRPFPLIQSRVGFGVWIPTATDRLAGMSPLPRLQLFEFNDVSWAGSALRDGIVETLGRSLRWGRMLRGLVEPYSRFLERAETTAVLDLCAGTGGPAHVLCEEFERTGRTSPHFLLTDLYPRPAAWQALCDTRPTALSFHGQPVDATRIPEDLSRGRARTIINAFHHFPPALAARILQHAVASRAPIFRSEAFHRNPLGFAPFLPAGAAALLCSPLLASEQRLAKAALTWLSPVTLAAGVWDGIVSTLRVYTEAELRAMSEPLGGGYTWVFESYRAPFGGKGYVYFGVPGR